MRLSGLIPKIFRTPARFSVLIFLIIIVIGTLLLSLPAASSNQPLSLTDAMFTSTSATCVTGLVVVDTGQDLSLFGQLVVLLLIQVGGLGIMTVSTAFLLAVGRRPSIGGRMMIQDTFTASGDYNLGSLIWDVVRFTFLMEGAGAVILFFRLLSGYSVFEALYYAIFHAVSAFCNAGFALFPDSLVHFQQDWLVNLVIGVLIISGGLGFLVVFELRRNFPFRRRTWTRLSLHTKLVLTTTGALLLLGTVLILVMEWNNTLQHLSVPHRFLAAFFQSITTRTAGFNTLPIGQMANETLFLMILLMFIGASSGSCGGGVKTGTIATLVVLALSRLRGQRRPQAFRRSISEASIARAISVVLISALVVGAAIMILLMTELGAVSHPESRGKFLELLFEAVSGFGTVGLSTGITPALTIVGKLTFVLVMFTGRLGPLVIALAISRRKAVSYHYAEENIMIG